MRLGWESAELRALCESPDGLLRRWPQHGKDAQLLLTMVASAASLFDLRRLQCLGVDVNEPGSPSDGIGVDVQHVQVRLRGALVNRHGSPLAVRPAGDEVEWMRRIDCLVVRAISIAQGATKATG